MAAVSEPKPYASLSSGLLARKGQARPAMRPQGFTAGYSGLAGMEDLGWNDMGHAPEPAVDIHEAGENTAVPEGVPQVLVQREQLSNELTAPARKVQALPPIEEREPLVDEPEVAAEPRFEAAVEPQPEIVPVAATRNVSVAAAARIARATRHKAKAAFTLRLDQDRHLRLRLASAVTGRSAQVLVTEALDAFLTALPEVEELAGQVPVRAKN